MALKAVGGWMKRCPTANTWRFSTLSLASRRSSDPAIRPDRRFFLWCKAKAGDGRASFRSRPFPLTQVMHQPESHELSPSSASQLAKPSAGIACASGRPYLVR